MHRREPPPTGGSLAHLASDVVKSSLLRRDELFLFDYLLRNCFGPLVLPSGLLGGFVRCLFGLPPLHLMSVAHGKLLSWNDAFGSLLASRGEFMAPSARAAVLRGRNSLLA